MLIKTLISTFLFVWILSTSAYAAQGGNHSKGSKGSLDTCKNINKLPRLDCATAPSSVFSKTGRLWIAWSYAGHVYVSYSDDNAKTYSQPVTVNLQAEEISAKGENRPKIALNNNDDIYITWTTPLEKRFTGNVRFSYSNNKGQSFSKPITINDNLDITGHRFDALTVADNGNIFISWLDKRDKFNAIKKGNKYIGAAVYYSWSEDGGKSFKPNKKIINNSCECCRIAIDTDTNDLPVILWRNIYGKNIRDHALVNFKSVDSPNKPIRASYDNWKIDACPHHGPDMSVSNSDIYHMVWFNNGEINHGLFYSKMTENEELMAPISFGNYKAMASHPTVLNKGNDVWISWKEFDGKNETLWYQRSNDNGDTWNNAIQISNTLSGSDYPFLISNKKSIYIQWKTVKQGFQLIALNK